MKAEAVPFWLGVLLSLMVNADEEFEDWPFFWSQFSELFDLKVNNGISFLVGEFGLDSLWIKQISDQQYLYHYDICRKDIYIIL